MDFLFNNLNTNPYISVYTVGYEKTKPNHSYGPTRRSGYMLHYVYSGKGEFICQGKTYHLKAGDFFFISPDATITYTADQTDPWAYYWFGSEEISSNTTSRKQLFVLITLYFL